MISFPHKTIFIHIPKCAGQSVEETFLNDIGLDWRKHRHLFGCFKKPSKFHSPEEAIKIENYVRNCKFIDLDN